MGGPDPPGREPGSFLARMLELNPPLPGAWLRAAGGLWAAANLAGHVWLWRRRGARGE